ncbi:TPA: hypothetical protein DIC40_06530 [Patescibacteria group bacterium]|nr:hypothetical protein [Candidatus Gracilibacteria bacterium]
MVHLIVIVFSSNPCKPLISQTRTGRSLIFLGAGSEFRNLKESGQKSLIIKGPTAVDHRFL